MMMRWILLFIALGLSLVEDRGCAASSSGGAATGGGGIVLRFRWTDGSIEKIQVQAGTEDTLTLGNILRQIEKQRDSKSAGESSSISTSKVQIGTKVIEDVDTKTISMLGLKHGSLVTVNSPRKTKQSNSKGSLQRINRSASKRSFDPFPELAKDYASGVLKKKTRSASGRMSYGALADLQGSLHIVEPQQKGSIDRIYICQRSAERFQRNCVSPESKTGKGKKSNISSSQQSIGLLLGTLGRERKDQHRPKKVSTSLSSQPRAEDFVQVAKVQAIWEPPSASYSLLDSSVLQIADWLDLKCIGWIFSYPAEEGRLKVQDGLDQDGLPVWESEIVQGGALQIERMKEAGRDDGKKFVTLAMDASSGATEAFQLSDVSVQMVAESLFLSMKDETKAGWKNSRFIETKYPVLIDGEETTTLDSVLCLVNTAMLAHDGIYSGRESSSSTKRSTGGLLNKTRKKLLSALAEKDDGKLLDILCDFSVLVALYNELPPKQRKSTMPELCQTLKKWARGQKKGAGLDRTTRIALEFLLST